MSFQETYHHEVLQSRRTRSERAHFWAKVVGVLLMVVIGATLRSEPQLRQALMAAGMDGVMKLTGKTSASQQQSAGLPGSSSVPDPSQMPDLSMMPSMADLQSLLTQGQNIRGTTTPQSAPQNRPRDAVRVNRFGTGQNNAARSTSMPQIGGGSVLTSPQGPDSTALSIDLNRLLQGMNPGK